MSSIESFWRQPVSSILSQLKSTPNGLSEQDVSRIRSQSASKKELRPQWQHDLGLFFAQFKSPLILLLVGAVFLSIVLGELADSMIILTVLITTGLLGFVQERRAGRAIEDLQSMIHSTAMVRRDGVEKEIPIEEVVAGDIILLNAGDIIPADALILQANDLHINESVLTGESFPVEKFEGSSEAIEITKASNAVFKGTSVVNGTALIVAVNTGLDTELGKISVSLGEERGKSTFEKGITSFGYLLMRLTIIFTVIILILNLVFHRPLLESLMFSLALTVGLTPELLPGILTITLAAGAKRMAAKHVIVKRLNAIQNLGQIDVLCSDKTGTITEGKAKLHAAINSDGTDSSKALLYAFLNASFETGFSNPIDESIREITGIDTKSHTKVDEVPYDFIRKRLSIVVAKDGREIMITKGAFKNILAVCNRIEDKDEQIDSITLHLEKLQTRFAALSEEGFRVIAISYKDVTGDPVINKDDEVEMIFLGFLVFSDPLKQGIDQSITRLTQTGIRFKMITGDNAMVACHLAKQIGLNTSEYVTGSTLHELTTEALVSKLGQVDVFAEILPAQKEQIIKAFQQAGYSVGYVGDGINDANALKAADVGVSISNAVDVAREAADIVLLDQNLDVLTDGILEGRKTFVNTLKYIQVTTSANFGNMFSMALASLFLPFLPLLPVQILLNNFLSDLPAIAIASDHVDEELVKKPRKWDMAYIWRFMIVFGLQSSLFDFATFGLLLYVFHASPEEFRTAWFMESLLTEIIILLIIRSPKTFFKSRPSRYLLGATIFTFMACITIPYLPVARLFKLEPLPFNLFACILVIIIVYGLVAETSKRFFLKKMLE